MANHDFNALHTAMQAQVDQEFLPCVSTALFKGREVVDVFCYGFADKEARSPLREDHIFRIFSNTKLVTTCAVMMNSMGRSNRGIRTRTGRATSAEDWRDAN